MNSRYNIDSKYKFDRGAKVLLDPYCWMIFTVGPEDKENVEDEIKAMIDDF